MSTHGGPRKRPSKSLRTQPKQEEPTSDDSAWIHRDKLAAIEIQEMEEAGMHVRQPHRSDSVGHNGRTTRSSSRSMSRHGVRRAQSKDMLADTADEPYTNGYDEYERKRVSTIPAVDDEEDYQQFQQQQEQNFDPRFHELRTAEEVAAEQYGPRQHTVRPSTSRIPISKISPAAASSNMIERDSSSPRSRSGSNAFPSTWDDLKRMRSGSAGSGILLDDTDTSHISRPASSHMRASPEGYLPHSPTKSKPLPAAPRLGGARSPSAQRPPSSAGNKRPTTAQNRPDGEAPWIATMYKPDPRLPPDQQMLPTHAKRIAQEQWEREGKTSSTYDRDFRLLDDNEITPPQQQTVQHEAQPFVIVQPPVIHDKENIPPTMHSPTPDEWPLTPSSERMNGAASPKPSVNNGGYRITPTVTATTPPQRSPVEENQGPVELPANERHVTRVPDYDEKDERAPKKGCCCVMM